MTSERQFDALLRSWLDASAPSDTPQGLLESVVSATAHTRPRPAWLVRLGGEPMPQAGRGELNRFAPLALAATAVFIALLIGIGLLVRPPNIGPGPTHSTAPGPSAFRAGTWTATADMSEPRVSHTATLLLDGKVLVTGGTTGRNLTATAELYNPASASWTAVGSMSMARVGHTATLLLDGRVLVAGGSDATGDLIATAELYDPVSGSWTAAGSMAIARGAHTATRLPDGQVLVAAGPATASTELYDPVTGIWTLTGTMVQPDRLVPTATLLLDGRVLVAGGIASDSPAVPHLDGASAELYDPSSGTWAATGSMTAWQWHHTATLLPDGRVLVAGGEESTTPDELYDPVTGIWAATESMINGRWGHTANLLPDGRVLVAGGVHNTGLLVNSALAELYDPRSGTWTATAAMAATRAGHTATLLLDGTVLVTGGAQGLDDGSPQDASAELYYPGVGD